MRLLNIHTFDFRIFPDDKLPPYAIASHRWVSDEIGIEDLSQRRGKERRGYKKLRGFCDLVRRVNAELSAIPCDWLWIGTCCIDQRSSQEVSEAVNSMSKYYAKATVCYAYLADVQISRTGFDETLSSLWHSEWFRRGWALQELLAPRTVVFLDCEWRGTGHKCTRESGENRGDPALRTECPTAGMELNSVIADITGIPEEVLWDCSRSEAFTVEERMAWTKGRQTTKPEDQAYCLLGIFRVHMPLVYGEGEEATWRLQEAIEKRKAILTGRELTNASQNDGPDVSPCSVAKLDLISQPRSIPVRYEPSPSPNTMNVVYDGMNDEQLALALSKTPVSKQSVTHGDASPKSGALRTLLKKLKNKDSDPDQNLWSFDARVIQYDKDEREWCGTLFCRVAVCRRRVSKRTRITIVSNDSGATLVNEFGE